MPSLEKLKTGNLQLQEDVAESLMNATQELKADTAKRFADMEQLTKAILFVAIISLVGVVVSVASLVFDQVRFNYEQSRQKSDESVKIDALTEELNNQKELLQLKN